MTQRIFDVENEKDMADLWDILLDSIDTIRKINRWDIAFLTKGNGEFRISSRFIRIEWHDKTEITRPIAEASEADVGKLCVFWNDINRIHYGVLAFIGYSRETPYYERKDADGSTFNHCRRLTKTEIEDLC